MEGLLIFDLPGLKAYLPDDLSPEALAGKTTGVIGQRLVKDGERIVDDDVRRYIRTGGQHLEAVSEIRNHMLHSRPATIEGAQVLYRWRPATNDYFAITNDWLQNQIDQIEKLMIELTSLRPLHKHAAFKDA